MNNADPARIEFSLSSQLSVALEVDFHVGLTTHLRMTVMKVVAGCLDSRASVTTPSETTRPSVLLLMVTRAVKEG